MSLDLVQLQVNQKGLLWDRPPHLEMGVTDTQQEWRPLIIF